MIAMGQCPVCAAYMPRDKMLVRAEPRWRVLVWGAEASGED